jgi:hypothetical protein
MAMRALQRCTELDQEAGGAWTLMAGLALTLFTVFALFTAFLPSKHP